MTDIGHNNGPSLDDGNNPVRVRIIRIHINDWVASTRGFSLEQEGFFWRIHLLLYDRMGMLTDDDAYNARALSCDIRTYRRLKAQLISLGKLQLEDGQISHPRIVREIEQFVAEYRRRSVAAKAREDRRRDEIGDTSGEDQPDFGSTSAGLQVDVATISAGLRPELITLEAKLVNENNECTATTVTTDPPEPSCARAFPKPKPIEREDSPLPPNGGRRSKRVPVERATEIVEALAAYNTAAETLGFAKADKLTKARALRLRARLDEIGGLEAFRQALSALPRNRFLMGKIPPRAGQEPFRLDLERLLSTGSGMGDVLASLMDAAGAGEGVPLGPNGRAWAWWRADEAKIRSLDADYWRRAIAEARPNGVWPWWLLTAPPGHPECLVHPVVLDEMGLVAIYQGRISHG